MKVVKPADLKIGDVVRFTKWVGPFGDHQVILERDGGFTLRRPYVDCDGMTGHEDGFWLKGSNFEFILLERK